MYMFSADACSRHISNIFAFNYNDKNIIHIIQNTNMPAKVCLSLILCSILDTLDDPI